MNPSLFIHLTSLFSMVAALGLHLTTDQPIQEPVEIIDPASYVQQAPSTRALAAVLGALGGDAAHEPGIATVSLARTQIAALDDSNGYLWSTNPRADNGFR